jgi:hypothetical protein
VPLVATFDAVLGAISRDVRRCLLVATRGRFHARLCGVVHDSLVVGGVMCGDVVRLLECASNDVAMFTSPWALLTASGRHAWVALVQLAMNLGFIMPSLPPPQWSLGREVGRR